MADNNPLLEAIKASLIASSQGTIYGPILNSLSQAQKEIDLGRIRITKPRQEFAETPQSSLPTTVTPPILDNQGPTQIPQIPGRSPIINFLKQLGIPLAASAAGSIFPSILPQAAGLSTGFAEAQERGRERQSRKEEKEAEKEFILVGADGKEKTRFKIGAKDIVKTQDNKFNIGGSDLYNFLNEGKLPQTTEEIVSEVTSKYKSGDTRIINGITYKRNDSGEWLPKP